MCVQLIILALLNLCVNSKKHCDALEIENISRIIIGIAEVQCVLCGDLQRCWEFFTTQLACVYIYIYIMNDMTRIYIDRYRYEPVCKYLPDLT